MAIQISIENDADTKPNYLVQSLTTPEFQDGRHHAWFGSNADTALVNMHGLKSLQALREEDWIDPDPGNFNSAKRDIRTGVTEVVMNGAAPTLTEFDIAFVQGAGFASGNSSLSAHSRRAIELQAESLSGAGFISTLEFSAFAANPDGTVNQDVDVGTQPAVDGRASEIFTPQTDGTYSSQAAGAPAVYAVGSQEYIYAGPGLDNELTDSRDITQSLWTGNATVTFDENGIDGTANSASRITSTGGGTFQPMIADYTMPATQQYITARAFVKKSDTPIPAGEGYVRFQFTITGQTILRSVILDPYSGEVEFTGTSAQRRDEYALIDHGDWWEILHSQWNQSSATTGTIRLFVDSSPPNGGSGQLNGSHVFGNVELHFGKTLHEVAGAPPVFSDGTAGSIPATELSVPIANHSNARAVYGAEVYVFTGTSEYADTQNTSLLNVGDAAESQIAGFRLTGSNEELYSEDAASEAVSPQAPRSSGGPVIVATAHEDTSIAEHAISAQGLGVPTGSSYTGFAVSADLRIGPGGAVATSRPFLIRNLRRFDLEPA